MTGTEYSEGYEARYYEDRSWMDNPYTEGAPEHAKWDDGFWDADMDLYDPWVDDYYEEEEEENE